MTLRVNKQQIDQAGINFVAAEFNRRGIIAAILANKLFKNVDWVFPKKVDTVKSKLLIS